MKTFFYGLFSETSQIAQRLIPGKKSDDVRGPVFYDGYLSAIRGNKKLFTHCRIYNSDEIERRLSFKPENQADLIFELYEKEGLAGFRQLNGKFTVVITEPGRTTIVRDRNGEGRMIYFTKDFFTDSYHGLQDFKDFQARPDLTGITTFLTVSYTHLTLPTNREV